MCWEPSCHRASRALGRGPPPAQWAARGYPSRYDSRPRRRQPGGRHTFTTLMPTNSRSTPARGHFIELPYLSTAVALPYDDGDAQDQTNADADAWSRTRRTLDRRLGMGERTADNGQPSGGTHPRPLQRVPHTPDQHDDEHELGADAAEPERGRRANQQLGRESNPPHRIMTATYRAVHADGCRRRLAAHTSRMTQPFNTSPRP